MFAFVVVVVVDFVFGFCFPFVLFVCFIPGLSVFSFCKFPFPRPGAFCCLNHAPLFFVSFLFLFFYERAKMQCSRRRICLAVLEEYCNERSSINQNSYVPQQYLLAQHQYSRHARYYKMLLPRRSLNERALRTRIKDRELF